MKNIVIGQYVPGDSYLYRLDPRTKIISLILLMVATFFLTTIPQILIAFLIAILILVSGKRAIKIVQICLVLI